MASKTVTRSIGLPGLARSLLTLIRSFRIYHVFQIIAIIAFITDVNELQALLDACSSTRHWEIFYLALKLGYINKTNTHNLGSMWGRCEIDYYLRRRTLRRNVVRTVKITKK